MFEAAETIDALEVPVFEAHLWCFNEHSRVCVQEEDQSIALSTLARARSRTEVKQNFTRRGDTWPESSEYLLLESKII